MLQDLHVPCKTGFLSLSCQACRGVVTSTRCPSRWAQLARCPLPLQTLQAVRPKREKIEIEVSVDSWKPKVDVEKATLKGIYTVCKENPLEMISYEPSRGRIFCNY